MRSSAALALACLLACAAATAVRAQPLPLPVIPVNGIINAFTTAPAVLNALGDAAGAGVGALADAGAIATSAGVIGASLPAYGAIQGSLKSITLNIIKALNGIGIAATQAGAGAVGVIGDAVTAPLLKRAEDIRAYHTAILAEAGKALGSGLSAVVTATKPFRALSPGALAIDALQTNLKALITFLQAESSLAPAAKKVILGPYIGTLQLISLKLSALKSALAGNLPLLGLLDDAASALGLPPPIAGDALGGLIDTAVNLIGGVIGV